MPDMNRRQHLQRFSALAAGLASWTVLAHADTVQQSPSRPAPGDGRVLLLRHARAPGTFDPPNFRLGDCQTQRNLDAEGRAQAEAIGRWFIRRGVVIDAVRSSPWCRCLDTAQLAFGRVSAWDMLGSPASLTASQRQQQLQALRHALIDARAQGGLQVWVSHMFVQQDLTAQSTDSGHGLLIQASVDGQPVVLDVWRFPAGD